MVQLRHPHIVQLVGAGKQRFPMLIYEYLEGGSLNHYIHDVIRSRLDHGSFFSIARDVALALNYLHKQVKPIIHLDVKSANVLLDAYLRAKLADLGLARVSNDNENNHVELNGPCGTPAWMAPEMLKAEETGEIKVSTATDVYGLGLILWEMKSAERPYTHLSLEEVCQAINNGAHLALPEDLPSEIKSLILACWHKDPSQRPTCDEIVGKLNQMSFPDHWKALFGASPLMDTPVDEEMLEDDEDLEPRHSCILVILRLLAFFLPQY